MTRSDTLQPLQPREQNRAPRQARWPRQVFGLMGEKRSGRPGLLDAASRVREDPVPQASFVPNYRCGTAPE